MDHLVAHVRGLDRAALAELIAARPDAAAWPEPRTLTELAERLSAVHSVQRALARISRAGLQVAEAMAALGGVSTEAGLAALLDVDESDPDRVALFQETLRTLGDLALVVRGHDRALVLAAPLRLLAEPLGLGVRLADVLPVLGVDRLRAMAEVWVDEPARRKDELVDQVTTAFADGEAVRTFVADAPADVRELLRDLAWNGPRLGGVPSRFGGWGPFEGSGPVAWALERGLLAQVSWDEVELPGEAGLALRGPDYRAPFTAPPPSPVSGVVAGADLLSAGTAAATQTLADTERLLDFCDRTPLRTTKGGRVTVREAKRAVKALGLSEDALGGLLSVASGAGLLGSDEGVVTLTERADAWREAEPAARLATLLAGWWSEFDGAPLRTRLVEYLTELPVGARADVVDAVAAVLSWRHPIAVVPTPADQKTLPARTAVAFAEAERYGVVALGAATPLARALVVGLASDPDGLAVASSGLVPTPVTAATFQSDLSAVVAGVPAAGLAALLDSAAEREAAGAASIWRFSAASVRAALDAGVDADALLTDLAAVATGGLPQALEYLVRDVARRHGHVRVAPAGSVVSADDPALLAELVATKSLRALRLRAVAPTVLVSAADPEATLAALRESGYAPTGLTEGGGARVERRVRRRATAPDPWPPHSENGGLSVDAPAVAERLLAAPVAPPPDPTPTRAPATAESRRPERVVALQADALSAAERAVLVNAIETGAPVQIDYVSATGRPSTRVIENAELTGDAVIAWCRLRTAERMFILSRIQSVSAAR
ncbi:helicase-associated domain-containing protein [Cryptosporangium minutisporangium]|uniref:Helicase-associated domain-containing protein n=1 Tax=Cryptosporangium minutisporangium TaxID=113569 RepID=A0ABP6T5I9_9ACTN